MKHDRVGDILLSLFWHSEMTVMNFMYQIAESKQVKENQIEIWRDCARHSIAAE